MNISFVRFVTIRKASELTGYSEDAIRTKISTGIWAENHEWKWGPDAVQLIDLEGYDTWANMTGKASTRGRRRSGSSSCIMENATLKLSRSLQPQPT